MHIGAIAIYDQSSAPKGQVRFKDILKFTEDRLHLAKTFRQRIVNVPFNFDHPYWIEDPDFDLEFHIRHIALPQPGDWRQLCIQAARIFARPMDLNRPLWEFTVVEGLDNIAGVPKGSFAILSKVHHAAIDGVSGVDMTAALHTLSADEANVPPPEKPWLPDSVPTSVELMARAYGNNIVQPFRFASVFAQSTPGLARMTQGLMSGDLKMPTTPNRVPRTRFNKSVSPHRVIDGRSFDMGVIKEMRKRLPGSTVNDVILAVVGGALRKYLESKNELPDESMIAMAPISVRSEAEKGALGNQVSAMMVGLGSHIKDPISRLHFTHSSAQDSKALTNAVGARQLADYSKFTPPMLTGVAARLYSRFGVANRVNPMFNTVVTNVPGPQIPLYSNGARLVTQYGMGPVYDGLGVFHPIYSYCGEITVSFTACRKMLPDPAFYADCIENSFEELRAATLKKPTRAARPKKTKAASEVKAAEESKPADAPASPNGVQPPAAAE